VHSVVSKIHWLSIMYVYDPVNVQSLSNVLAVDADVDYVPEKKSAVVVEGH
jgi:hypothetical protein